MHEAKTFFEEIAYRKTFEVICTFRIVNGIFVEMLKMKQIYQS